VDGKLSLERAAPEGATIGWLDLHPICVLSLNTSEGTALSAVASIPGRFGVVYFHLPG
jgi:hypothetical protein